MLEKYTLIFSGNFMISRILVCTIFFVANSCFGNEVEQALNRAGLVERKIPVGDAWSAANQNLIDYVIANDAGRVTVKEEKRLRNQDSRVTFHDKHLVGSNRGEWGGNLSVVAPDGARKVLIADNIVQLVQEKDELFVFTGTAHGGIARGAIYKVSADKNGLSAEKLTLLPGAPAAVTVERNEGGYFKFFVVTNDGLLSFSPEFGVIKVLAIDQFWSGLYPSSVQLVDSQLIIGIRSGVVLVNIGADIGIGSKPSVTKIRYFSRTMQ